MTSTTATRKTTISPIEGLLQILEFRFGYGLMNRDYNLSEWGCLLAYALTEFDTFDDAMLKHMMVYEVDQEFPIGPQRGLKEPYIGEYAVDSSFLDQVHREMGRPIVRANVEAFQDVLRKSDRGPQEDPGDNVRFSRYYLLEYFGTVFEVTEEMFRIHKYIDGQYRAVLEIKQRA